VNRDSGTDRANGGWLRRLVRHQRREIHNKIKQIQTLTHLQAPHLLAASNQRELNPNSLPMTYSSQIEILNLPPSQSTQKHLKPILMPNEKS
jgi:hypothetical protein